MSRGMGGMLASTSSSTLQAGKQGGGGVLGVGRGGARRGGQQAVQATLLHRAGQRCRVQQRNECSVPRGGGGASPNSAAQCGTVQHDTAQQWCLQYLEPACSHVTRDSLSRKYSRVKRVHSTALVLLVRA